MRMIGYKTLDIRPLLELECRELTREEALVQDVQAEASSLHEALWRWSVEVKGILDNDRKFVCEVSRRSRVPGNNALEPQN